MPEQRQVYVGHRYVPKIMGEWSSQESYEGLSIVTFEGTSYTSKKYVPFGVLISNSDFWVVTGNYNAQVENYRQEVKQNTKDLNDFKIENGIQLNNKIHVEATVSDLINNNLLSDGVVVTTKGYHIVGDGGGANYIIVDHTGVTGDGGVLIDLSNGLQAKLFETKVNTRQLGLREGEQSQDKINNAIKSPIVKKVTVVDKLLVYKKGTGVTDLTQIDLKSNMIFKFLPGASLTLNPSPNEDYYRMLNIANIDNVKIINPWLIGDVGLTSETTGEYGHGLYIVNSNNIDVYSATCDKMFGDGYGIAGGSNINFYGKTKANQCRRQGLSLVAGSDIYIENIEGTDIKGNPPMAVVDIEPNNVDDHIKNVHIGRIYGKNVVRALLITGGGDKEITVGTIETNQENNDYVGFGEIEVHGNGHRVSLSVDKLISRNVTDKNIIKMVNTNENVDVSISEMVLDNYTRTSSVLTTQLVPFLFEYVDYNTSKSGKLYIGHITSKNIIMSIKKFDFYLNLLGNITVRPTIEDVYIPFLNDQENAISNFTTVKYKNSMIGLENKVTKNKYLAGDMFSINPKHADNFNLSKFDLIEVVNPLKVSFNLIYTFFDDYTLSEVYPNVTKDTVVKSFWITGFNGWISMNHELKTITLLNN